MQVQLIQDEFTIEVYEDHARFALQNVNTTPIEHHQQNDINEFNRCQTQLKELYQKDLKCDNVIEFTCYQLLYCLFSQQYVDFNTFIHSIPRENLENVNIQMVINNPKETTYLIYGVYALYCVIVAFINVQKFYKEQQNEKKSIKTEVA